MQRIVPCIMALILAFCVLPTTAKPREQTLATRKCDLDVNHTPETIVITCRGWQSGHPMGGDIIVMQPRAGVLKTIWRQPKLNPWKLEIADVDGDGRKEIVVGVWKKSPKDQVMARRVFVYNWDGKRMVRKWLGSRLSRRFDDFTLTDVNHDGWDELISLEVAPGGRHRVAVYRWLVFGFDWLGCSPEMKGLKSLSASSGLIRAATDTGKPIFMRYTKGKVIIVRQRRNR